jgi:hypothetical protein
MSVTFCIVDFRGPVCGLAASVTHIESPGLAASVTRIESPRIATTPQHIPYSG